MSRAISRGLLAAGILLLQACGQAPLDDDAAVNALLGFVKSHRLYADRGGVPCLTFIVEESEPARVGIAVRERHEAPCAGAPGIAPIVDRYRITRRTAGIERLDVLGTGRYLPVMAE